VNGTGFATTGPGVYVGVAETGKYSTTDSSAYNLVTWVPSTQISADGSFSVTLDVAPVFGQLHQERMRRVHLRRPRII
jgi:hypothetical protein